MACRERNATIAPMQALRWMMAVLVLSMRLVAAAETQTFTGRVVSVHDGDTLTVLDASSVQHKVRLHGIDAPETKQAFGTKSRDRLAEIAKGKPVKVIAGERDKYGRTLGRIEVEGQDVNRQMVADGLAWHYKRYSKAEDLAAAEREARAARRGLWADKAPVPPWDWRATDKGRRREPAER